MVSFSSKLVSGATFTILLVLLGLNPVASFQSSPPKDLLIFYGWPSTINGCNRDVGCAANEFGQYDYVVLGDGLQDPGHPDHNKTSQTLAALSSSTVVFGYIDLGVSTQNLNMTEIKARMDSWQGMGIDGIFLDDFGYDWLVTRERQNEAVEYAHLIGLPVAANSFRPEDAFGDDVVATYNPDGLATSLGSTDYYLYESYQIILGQYVQNTIWRAKAGALEEFEQQHGFKILSVTTTTNTSLYDEGKFHYAWYSALIDGHAATGWGEYSFSSGSSSAPYRARPYNDTTIGAVGERTTAGTVADGNAFRRQTTTGTAFVDAADYSYGFVFSPTSGVKGDPHFVTWHGENYDYHGLCTLELVSDPSFASGKGLDVHIKTEIVDNWSYIKSAVVRIGQDILEVMGGTDGNHYWFNRKYQGGLTTMGDDFPVTFSYPKAKSKSRRYSINFGGNNGKIEIKTYKEFVRVNFIKPCKELYGNAVGLLGDFVTGKKLARDGYTEIKDYNEFGQEWQVVPGAPHLFHEITGPQAPFQKCILPDKNAAKTHRHLHQHKHKRHHRHRHGRRLGKKEEEEEEFIVEVTELDAKAACEKAGVSKSELDACTYDILATDDLDMAGSY